MIWIHRGCLQFLSSPAPGTWGKLTALKRKGIPIIQRLDGMNWIHRKRFTGLRHYFRSEVNNWILSEIRSRYANKVIYQSEFSRDWWNRVYGSKPTPNEVIYNGVDLDQFDPGGISDKEDQNCQ